MLLNSFIAMPSSFTFSLFNFNSIVWSAILIEYSFMTSFNIVSLIERASFLISFPLL